MPAAFISGILKHWAKHPPEVDGGVKRRAFDFSIVQRSMGIADGPF